MKIRSKSMCERLEPRTLFAGAAIGFASHVDFVAGSAPVALVAADFNGDGNQDLAVADSGSNEISLFFGNGAGAFSAGATLSLSGVPSAIITGDFNGDGKPDLAVACSPATGQTTTSVTVFLNTGSGGFGLGQITTVETGAVAGEAVSMVAGDFNKDGFLDLAVTDYTTESISILLGTGTGIFAAPVNYVANAHPTAIATADFDGDGNLDLAVTNTQTDSSGNTTNAVGILMGSATGDFTAGANLSVDTSGSPISVVAADFSTASDTGLIVGSSDGTAEVFADSSGTFTATAEVNVGAEASGIATGDFNLDGDLDFVAANGGTTAATSNDSITVVPGVGGGQVSAATQFPTGTQPADVVVADFNNDGKPDIATANEAAGTVSILINNTAVTLVTTKTVVTSSAASSPADTDIDLTATVTGSTTSPLPNSAYPTGTVDFYDGATLLGTATIATGSNQAVLTTDALIVGVHTLKAVYLGDDAYAASTSPHFSQAITPTAGNGPDLVGTFVSSSLGALVAPGETGTVTIQVTNQGTTNATGAITSAVYLSLDSLLDSSDTQLALHGGLATAHLNLKPGKSVLLTGTVTVPQSMPLASYSLLTQINSGGSLLESDSTNNLVIAPAAYTVADVFGTVGGKRNVPVEVSDPEANPGTFRLIGPGVGTVNVGDDGVDLVLTGTTAASVLTITTSANGFDLNSLTADGPIRTVQAPGVGVDQSITLPGSAATVNFLSFGSNPSDSITLGAGTQTTLNLGYVAGATLTAVSGIKSLTVNNWDAGSITAPSIGTLKSKAEFDPSMTLTGTGITLKSASIGGAVAGDWSSNGSIGSIVIKGDLNSGIISADANITSVVVGGSVTTSQIVAGLTGPGIFSTVRIAGSVTDSLIGAGAIPNGTAAGLPVQGLRDDGTIRAITVVGAVDADTRFLAATEPKKVLLHGVAITPIDDPRFQV